MTTRAIAGIIAVALLWGISSDKSTTEEYSTDYSIEELLSPVEGSTQHTAQLIAQVFSPYSTEDSAYMIAWHLTWEAKKRGINPFLMTSLVLIESRVNPQAISYKGAIGLGQVMPNIWLGVYDEECGTDLFDVKTNLCYSASVLRFYLDKYDGDVTMALRGYGGLGSKTYYKLVLDKHEDVLEQVSAL